MNLELQPQGRQVTLDLETTGMSDENRIIEVGCVEMENRQLTGRILQSYVDPERDIEPKAQEVHGISREQLQGEPKFAEIAEELLDFVCGAEVLIHNAQFDLEFLNRELRNAGYEDSFESYCEKVVDTLELAKEMHPGGNSLDQLCDLYKVDRRQRDKHGALLDAQLLAQIYLRMTGGQLDMTLKTEVAVSHRVDLAAVDIPVVPASEEELRAHQEFVDQIQQSAT